MFQSDQKVLRELGKKLAEIAADPFQNKTRQEWFALNRLKPVRPMFIIDELPWHEMEVGDELKLQCKDVFCQSLEQILRRSIYRWNHFRDDFVYDPTIYVPMKINGIGHLKGYDLEAEGLLFGIESDDEEVSADDGNRITSHNYCDLLQSEEDLEKLRFTNLTLNQEETARRAQIAHEAFDGVLDVIMDGYIPMLNTWDNIITWRGMDNVLFDLIDRPEFVHETVNRITDISLKALDQLEDRGLLGHPQQLVHCSGAWTDELPKDGYDPAKPRAKDVWTYGMAQIFCTASPAIHNEFEVEYAKKWYSRFGLGYYGCCEPLDDRLEFIKTIPNIRKISVSAWVKDYERFAEELESKYVYSNKPTPAHLLSQSWDPDFVEKGLRERLAITVKHNCPTEFILKDLSTVDYHPEHIWQWADIMRKICHGG